MMSTRSGRIRPSVIDTSPPRTRKGVSPPRSPARSRKISPPARSPSRKSPARKSPSRKTTSKYPARKSPSRTNNKESETSNQKSPVKRPAIKSNVEIQLQDFSSKIDSLRARPRRSEYSVKDISGYGEYLASDKINGIESDTKDLELRNRKPVEEVAPRRSSRLRDIVESIPDIRRSLSKSVSKSISHSIDTFSDEDNSEDELKISKSATRKLATPLRDSVSSLVLTSSKWEFGGRVGSALLIIFLPIVLFFVLIACSNKCSLNKLVESLPYKSMSVWFSPTALWVVTCQLILQAVIALVPIFGTKTDRMDDSNKKYCFNALFASIVSVNLMLLLDYLEVINNNTILSDYLKLATISYLFGLLISIAVYVKSRKIESNKLNPYGNTGYVLYDYFVGREIHPFVKKLDIKLWLSRVSNINAVILCVLVFQRGFQFQLKPDDTLNITDYKDVINKINWKPTILVFSIMQIVYVQNFIMKEQKITSTFSWNSEGVGYLQIVSSLLYPFYFTSISKYVAETDLILPPNALIGTAAIFLLGLFIMLYSNNIKYEFRKNPLHPSLTYLESMPTFHGKKLLVSGLWGIVRHPNYTGDILIHMALALPGIWTQNVFAAAPAITTILVLLHRAWRDHSRCKRRYGAAWQRYCKRVPSVFIPKVL